jgi:2-enoate reductase
MTIGEIQAITESFIRMAEIARDTGFDGVEVHAIHEGYLLDQFTIECTNMRKDEYGGSLENRMRLPREIIEGIKHACGRDFVVSVRYSVVSKMKGFNSGALPGEYYTEFGRSLEQSPSVARILEAAGCDVLNADNGSYDAWYWAHPPVYMPEACNLPEAAYIKNFLNIPVLCAGRMDNPDRALLAVQSGQIDGIGLARALLADPYYVEKVREGRVSDIRPCIACHSVCLNMELHASGGCAVNPTVLHEREYEAQNSMKVTKAKKVAVIGGNSRDGSRM